jgi:predicted dehydrogenase
MRTQLYGTAGTIVVDNTDNFITIYKQHINSNGKVLDGAYGLEQENEVHIRYPIAVNNHNVSGEHDAFISAILEDKPVPTDGREGMATVKVCRAVIDSADNKKTVTIEY